MPFHSILYPASDNPIMRKSREAPDYFHDLNLDQIVETVTADWRDYDLSPIFHTRPSDIDVIVYRQAIMRDLENKAVMQSITDFALHLRAMRGRLERIKKLYYKYEKARWHLGAVECYCEGVERLSRSLHDCDLSSQGMRDFRKYLDEYLGSTTFRRIAADTRKLKSDFSAIRYCLHIKGNKITVRYHNSETDYNAVVEETFAKFRQDVTKNYLVKFPQMDFMNHIEAQILDGVAFLFPNVFNALDAFCTEHELFQDQKILEFDREVHFYVAYLALVDKLRRVGLNFCYPQISENSKEINGLECFDLALAHTQVNQKAIVVCNDFFLRGTERIFVVSGPNQGGKTTFARMIGQLHYLASLGCMVPGTEARLFLFDHLFSHFEKEENIKNLRGKLKDDLFRIRRILDRATPKSVIIMNEIFSSTTLKDAASLSKRIIAKISDLDLICVWVTFLDELSSFNEKTVSIVSTVYEDNPVERTYRLVRRPADGLAYAISLAEKHHVTYEWLKRRIRA